MSVEVLLDALAGVEAERIAAEQSMLDSNTAADDRHRSALRLGELDQKRDETIAELAKALEEESDTGPDNLVELSSYRRCLRASTRSTG